MSALRPAARRYVERHGIPDAVVPLAGDASTRRFYRIHFPGGATRILMDYGEPFSGETDDIRLARIFHDARLPVPRQVDTSGEAGCILLEDLGDRTLERALAETDDDQPPPLLREAVGLAADVALRGTPVLARSPRAAGPSLDAERFRFEMDFFAEHYVGKLRRRELPGGLLESLHDLADLATRTPRAVLCHRDFHSRNLMVTPEGRLTMVDIQDARWGPDSYDLASLLRDAYTRIEEAWVDPLIDLYLDRFPDPGGRDDFRRRFDIVSAQRMIKALGTFGYQVAVRGNRRYEEAIRPTVGRLRRLLPRLGEPARLADRLGDAGVI